MRLRDIELGGDAYLGSVFFVIDRVPLMTRNAFDVAHGGALTTYVDISTTAAIYAFDAKERTQVSAQLDMQFFNAAKLLPEGEHPLIIEARVQKIGKTLAFTRADLTD